MRLASRHPLRKWLGRKHSAAKPILAVAVVSLILTALGTGTALASTNRSVPSFAGQARSAGLTASQTWELQREVNSYLRKFGGTQVAINQVDFPGGNIVFAVPGERFAHEVTGSPSASGLHRRDGENCPYLDFCAFQGTDYSGNAVDLYQCNQWHGTLWTSNGSWKNDQTPGTQAHILYADGTKYTTPGAWSANSDFSWADVTAYEACT
jgi:hypothetical protein